MTNPLEVERYDSGAGPWIGRLEEFASKDGCLAAQELRHPPLSPSGMGLVARSARRKHDWWANTVNNLLSLLTRTLRPFIAPCRRVVHVPRQISGGTGVASSDLRLVPGRRLRDFQRLLRIVFDKPCVFDSLW